MIPPCGAQPPERTLHALAKRGRLDGALAFAEERQAQRRPIFGPQLAEHGDGGGLELGGEQLLLGARPGVREEPLRQLAHPRPGELEHRAERRAIAVGEPREAVLQRQPFLPFHPVSVLLSDYLVTSQGQPRGQSGQQACAAHAIEGTPIASASNAAFK